MSPAERFATILSILGVLLGGITVTAKLLWNVSKQWQKASDSLVALGKEIKELVVLKERDHQRLERRDDRLEERFERHEAWHADRNK